MYKFLTIMYKMKRVSADQLKNYVPLFITIEEYSSIVGSVE